MAVVAPWPDRTTNVPAEVWSCAKAVGDATANSRAVRKKRAMPRMPSGLRFISASNESRDQRIRLGAKGSRVSIDDTWPHVFNGRKEAMFLLLKLGPGAQSRSYLFLPNLSSSAIRGTGAAIAGLRSAPSISSSFTRHRRRPGVSANSR